jgi:hypothetical protein
VRSLENTEEIVFHYSIYFSSIFSIFSLSFHYFLPYFAYHFTIQPTFPILFSNSWRTQYILEQWEFFEIKLNHRRILKLNYVGNIIE